VHHDLEKDYHSASLKARHQVIVNAASEATGVIIDNVDNF
jgi:hypothetical protein